MSGVSMISGAGLLFGLFFLFPAFGWIGNEWLTIPAGLAVVSQYHGTLYIVHVRILVKMLFSRLSSSI